MKPFVTGVIFASLMILGGCSRTSQQLASAGPNGGDLVPIKGGAAVVEVLANADTGEVVVQTWDKDLKSRRSIEREPITVGSGENSVELVPHPMDTDPSGACSRFYGQADWVRGGGVRQGWMHGGGAADHLAFDWNRCWQAGRAHGHMWTEMGEHRHMGPGHGPVHHGGGMEQ